MTLKEDELAAIKQALKDIGEVLGRVGKRQNALNSAAKAKANGNHPGRKKLRNDEIIRKLRRRGLSIRAIAKLEGVSTTAVQRALSVYGGGKEVKE